MKAKQKFNMGGRSAVKPFLRRSRVVSNYSRLITILLMALTSLLALSCKDTSTANSEVAAKVGSHEITIKQVDSAIKQQLDQNGSATGPLSPAELIAARMSALDNLIQE